MRYTVYAIGTENILEKFVGLLKIRYVTDILKAFAMTD
jgi:hypothetical protein